MKVIYDLFPARVRVIPSERISREELSTTTVTTRIPDSRMVDAVRIVISDDTVMIAADSSNGPTLIFREKYSKEDLDLQKKPKSISRLTTSTGKMLIFEKDSNCGCGSRLRGWNPYRTLEA